jgi:hypothetical protein
LYPKNDWDSFEELHVTVELLELSQQLLRSRSRNKARAAVILMDHVADALMYRICTNDFEMQSMMELVMPPEVTAEKRAEILFRFEKKVSYLLQTRRLISTEDAAILLIGHRVRNFAYHRDYHNPNTVSMVGRILYKTICELLPILSWRGHYSCSSRTKEKVWMKRYGVTAAFPDYQEALQSISRGLTQRLKINLSSAARILRMDLLTRYRRVRWTLDNWFSFKRDKDLDVMLKHYEFGDVHSAELEEFHQPLKDARYMIHDLYKGLPPERWQKISVDPKRRYEIRRAMVVAERNFKTLRRKAFQNFSQTITARSLREMNRKIRQLTAAPSLSQLLSQYSFLDRELTRVRSYVSRAEAAAEAASDIARGK